LRAAVAVDGFTEVVLYRHARQHRRVLTEMQIITLDNRFPNG
jgi:hypothetical protein